VATRFVIADTDPFTLGVMRYGLAVICLFPVLVSGRHWRIERRDLVAIALLGVLFFSVFPVLFAAGLARTTSARGALALSTMPLLTMAVAAMLRVEPLTVNKLAGVLLAVTGVAIALSGGLAGAPPEAWQGDLLMVGAALCGALFAVLSRRYFLRYPTITVTFYAMTIGTLGLLLVGLGSGVTRVPDLTLLGWSVVAFLGVFGGAIGLLLWNWGLKNATPTRVAVTVTANPVAAIAFGTLLLGEPFTLRLLFGLLAVGGGVVLASWRPAAPAPPPRP
jgi:drug/metabolite transporter (DMT)-like permease